MKKGVLFLIIISLFNIVPLAVFADADFAISPGDVVMPLPLSSYNDANYTSLSDILIHRIEVEPFNLVATIIFLLAIIHTFMAGKFVAMAHHVAHHHKRRVRAKKTKKVEYENQSEVEEEVSFLAEVLHFLGEVEAIFGLWGLVLVIAGAFYYHWHTVTTYIAHKVNFTEPMFVVVVMTLASTRPVIRLSEIVLQRFAKLGGGSAAAWWFTIMTIGPILGSFITEPGAMTISAMLLAKQFYERKPSPKFAYATIGLLFVNISVGGTLTHFAAPPVLMVATTWNWNMAFMFMHFGWKAVLGIFIANSLYYFVFRNEFSKLLDLSETLDSTTRIRWEDRTDPIPFWVTAIHVVFLVWTVFTAHYPALFIGGFLFFLGFAQSTVHHQNRINLKPALLVGFFLAGLVIHGGLQAWWIAPVLSSLGEIPLMLSATFLTAFNDNAAITYLSTLVPGFGDAMKYAVVAGAVTGGGLTVIANAPNPAGQSILSKYFGNGVSPAGLALGALIPTIIMGLAFMLIR